MDQRKIHLQKSLFVIGIYRVKLEFESDSVPKVASFTKRDIFNIWRMMKIAGSVSSNKLLHGPHLIASLVSIVTVLLIEPQMNWFCWCKNDSV
ncbi:hypothetical protein P8452_03012 [Trifolium repens]|nr:hypothetical protein P8452_03012 [Trifolium repens]